MGSKVSGTDGASQPAFDIDSGVSIRKLSLLSDMEMREPSLKDIFYSHSLLSSALFPSSEPAEDVEFVSKTNGALEYVLEAGVDPVTKRRRFPYGKYPRLIMTWIAKQIRSAGGRRTQYVDPETHTITIPSIWRLCEDMGIPHGGSTDGKLQEQLYRLLSCRISIRRSTGVGFKGRRVHDTVYMPLVEAVRMVADENRAQFSGAAFVLTEEVYRRLARESAPFDMRAATYLLSGRSVLPYDLYVWLAGSMKELRHDLPVKWDWLYDRFGRGQCSMRRFRRVFRAGLEKVRDVYPGLRVTVGRDVVVLHPSPTPISPRRGGRASSEDVELGEFG